MAIAIGLYYGIGGIPIGVSKKSHRKVRIMAKVQDLVAYLNHRTGEKNGKPYDMQTMTAYRIVGTEPGEDGRFQDNARLNFEAKEDGSGYRDRSEIIAPSVCDRIVENSVVFENPEDPNTSIAFMRSTVHFKPEHTEVGKDGVERTVKAHQFVNPKNLEKVTEDMLPEGVTDYESAAKFIRDNRALSYENGKKNQEMAVPEATAEEVAEVTPVEIDAPTEVVAEVEASGPEVTI